MGRIRRLVLDTLKPHQPNIIDVASRLSDLEGVTAVNIGLYEIDLKVENAKVSIEGDDIAFDEVRRVLQEAGAAIHSIDEVVAGATIMEAPSTLQD